MDPGPAEEQLTVMDLRTLQRIDPLKKQAESGLDGGQGLSPMNPPDAYAPPGMEPVPETELHPFLRRLRDKHVPLIEELGAFEEAILAIHNSGFTRESDARLRRFFHFLEREFSSHKQREETVLFPLLHARLIANGEHGRGTDPTTAIDVMQDEHSKAMQLAAVIVSFMGLALRLPDQASRLIVLDAALEHGKSLVELLRLHVFRESNLICSLAHRLISSAELDALQSPAASGEEPGRALGAHIAHPQNAAADSPP
jgi:iron-sulfur cluster repair protein YtfE (RIC family)